MKILRTANGFENSPPDPRLNDHKVTGDAADALRQQIMNALHTAPAVPPTPQVGDVWYRYVYTCYEDGSVTIRPEEWYVQKTTPKGVWIVPSQSYISHPPQPYPGWRRFVLLNTRKKFAAPVLKDALLSFHERKCAQLKVLHSQAELIERVIYLARTLQAEMDGTTLDIPKPVHISPVSILSPFDATGNWPE